MIHNLAFTSFLGFPLFAYLGIITLLLLLTTMIIGALNFKGIRIIPFKWHPRLALATITIGLFHGFLGASILFNF
jgi:hypothetical protein